MITGSVLHLPWRLRNCVEPCDLSQSFVKNVTGAPGDRLKMVVTLESCWLRKWQFEISHTNRSWFTWFYWKSCTARAGTYSIMSSAFVTLVRPKGRVAADANDMKGEEADNLSEGKRGTNERHNGQTNKQFSCSRAS